MNLREVLKQGIEKLKENNIEDASLKAKMLLSEILEMKKEYLIVHEEEILDEPDINTFFEKIDRLVNNEPIQYILNRQDFMGLNLYVDSNVLIPQPDTEILVEEVIALASEKENLKILDMCTGSGAIAISLAKYIKNSNVYATDISEKALEIAKDNSLKNITDITFIHSDVFENVKENEFDFIVSNPPYIETDVIKTISKEVQNEPHIALDGGEDGLYFYRKISKEAFDFLKQDGYLAFEIGYNQREAVENLLRENGYKNIYSKKDLGGNDRIVIGQK